MLTNVKSYIIHFTSNEFANGFFFLIQKIKNCGSDLIPVQQRKVYVENKKVHQMKRRRFRDRKYTFLKPKMKNVFLDLKYSMQSIRETALLL